MNKPRRKGLSDGEIERGLEQLMRRKSWLVPTTIEQVQEAELSLDEKFMEIPDSLSNSGTIRKKLAELALREEREEARGSSGYWTHSSVLLLAGTYDPVRTITERTRELVLRALERGWTGPPYDPFELAEMLRIKLTPTQDVIDARTTSNAGGEFSLEFNPSRSPARIRYSIAHEIAHTLFPDCAAAVRYRGTHENMRTDEWQLEMLCNVAASEILMPIGSLGRGQVETVSVDVIADLRKRYQVSSEAVLLRLARLTHQPCLVFAARRDDARARYRIDYSLASRSWRHYLKSGFLLPKNTKANECSAIGYTAKGVERWTSSEDWNVEYLGIPPYRGQPFPRVVGIASRVEADSQEGGQLVYVKGSATEPRGTGPRVIVQIVNDQALTWGAGFAKAVRQTWPEQQTTFSDWMRTSKRRLGDVMISKIDSSLSLASLIAQHGYGPSPRPRIRYRALAECLEQVAGFAKQHNATVHMPRIGSGESGGSWEIVSEIIDEIICAKEINVMVYDLPNAKSSAPKQQQLLWSK